MSPHQRPLLGVSLVLTAVAFFAALDTTNKVVSVAVPAVMALWTRYAFQSVVMVASMLPRSGVAGFRTHHIRLHLTRAAAMVTSSCAAYFSLRVMPLAEVTAIAMLTPLIVTLVGAVAYGERVSPARWLLMMGALFGAIIIVRPGSDLFQWYSLIPLIMLASNTVYQTLTSKLARLEDANTLHLWGGGIGLAAFSVALPFAWEELHRHTWYLLVLLGFFSTAGHYLLILAYRNAPMSIVTPYLYVQIGFAVMSGWLIFAETPDAWAIVGMVIIAICGAGGTWLVGREFRNRPVDAQPSAFPAG